jgi:hypothetical protein
MDQSNRFARFELADEGLAIRPVIEDLAMEETMICSGSAERSGLTSKGLFRTSRRWTIR